MAISVERRKLDMKHIQKAFISDAAYTIGDHNYVAVVTADAIDRDTGKIEITCDILGYCEAVSITLNQDDLIAVRGLLGLPDMDTYFSAFDVALKALEEIVALEDRNHPEWTDNFKFRQALDYAQQALANINGEAGHDTPNDS